MLDNGTVQCWGDNSQKQLGDGSTSNASTPVVVDGIEGATALASGWYHSCALLITGQVQCWGRNYEGQLGDSPDGGTTLSSKPVFVNGITNAVAIAAGAEKSCAVLDTGKVNCWGNGGASKLSLDPEVVAGISDAVAIAVGQSAAVDHSCAVIGTGQVLCWGDNGEGQLGNGFTGWSDEPVTVLGISDAIAVTAGREHSCALLRSGEVRCWGRNNLWQLGGATTASPLLEPTVVTGVSNAIAITTGNDHSCALLETGLVQCWGLNGNTYLGEFEDGPIGGISHVSGIVAGEGHICVLQHMGAIQCWGYNTDGQLGNGQSGYMSHRFSYSPVVVVGLVIGNP